MDQKTPDQAGWTAGRPANEGDCNGRMWILEYINEIKCCDLSVELILKVNILRSCIKFAKDEKEELILWNRLNKVISEVK